MTHPKKPPDCPLSHNQQEYENGLVCPENADVRSVRETNDSLRRKGSILLAQVPAMGVSATSQGQGWSLRLADPIPRRNAFRAADRRYGKSCCRNVVGADF